MFISVDLLPLRDHESFLLNSYNRHSCQATFPQNAVVDQYGKSYVPPTIFHTLAIFGE